MGVVDNVAERDQPPPTPFRKRATSARGPGTHRTAASSPSRTTSTAAASTSVTPVHGPLTKLMTGCSQGGSLNWSPDGKRIVTAGGAHGPRDVVVMTADGGEKRAITTQPGRRRTPTGNPRSRGDRGNTMPHRLSHSHLAIDQQPDQQEEHRDAHEDRTIHDRRNPRRLSAGLRRRAPGGRDLRGQQRTDRVRRLLRQQQAGRHLVHPARRGRAAPAHRRPRPRHLPGVLRRRQADRVLQRPDRRLRDLGDGRQRQAGAPGHPARDLRSVPGLLARRQPAGVLRRTAGGEQHRPVGRPHRGGAPTQLTNTPDTLEENPVWSPDGTNDPVRPHRRRLLRAQLWTMDVALRTARPS